MGVRGDLLNTVVNYLQDRTLQVSIYGKTSTERSIMASVPQESVLGPLLWNVYINELLQLIPEALAYADDCTVSFTSSKLSNMGMQETATHTLEIMVQWSKELHVKLAPEKTQALTITRKRLTEQSTIPLVMDGIC